MASLEAINATLRESNENQQAGHMLTAETVDRLHTTMKQFVKMMQIQNMKMLEAMREKQDSAAKETAAGAGQAKPDSNIGAIIAAISALAIGFLAGIRDSLKAYAKLFKLPQLMAVIEDALKSLKTRIGTAFTKLFAPIRTFFSAKGGTIANLIDDFTVKSFVLFDDAIKFLDTAFEPVKKLFSAEGRIMKIINALIKPFTFPFEGLIDDAVKPFKAIFTGGEDGVSLLTKIINKIKAPFTLVMNGIDAALEPIKTAFGIFKEGSKFMTALGSIGRIMGRLFFPITLIMTAYDTIKGMLDGFEQDGVLGGLAGAIKGLLNSIIGMPLDLLKSAVSWLLGKFGFSEAEKALDSFSFGDIITKMINGLVNGIIEGIATVVENLPLVPDAVGDKIRAFKIGQSDAAAATGDSPTAMEGGNNAPKPNRFERSTARLDRKRRRMDNEDMANPAAGSPNVIVNAPSSRGGDTNVSSSSTAIAMPAAASMDYSFSDASFAN